MFAHVGEIMYPVTVGSADAVLEAAIEVAAMTSGLTLPVTLITCDFADLGVVSAGAGRPNSAGYFGAGAVAAAANVIGRRG